LSVLENARRSFGVVSERICSEREDLSRSSESNNERKLNSTDFDDEFERETVERVLLLDYFILLSFALLVRLARSLFLHLFVRIFLDSRLFLLLLYLVPPSSS
jgi:hypothetical protein